RAAGRDRHRVDRRTVLSVAVGEEMTGQDRTAKAVRHIWIVVTAISLVAHGFSRAESVAQGFSPADAPPQRIVSLVPAVTEMIFTIGDGARVAAVSNYDHFPA